MNKLKKEYPLEGFIDTHIHTSPDCKPRKINDLEAAELAIKEKMGAIVIKSHIQPTYTRSKQVQDITGFTVWGGVCLNHSVGGINVEIVKTAASQGGKIIWLPTISYPNINLNYLVMEEILGIIAEYGMVLATGHLKAEDIWGILDLAGSVGVKKVMVNHPLTRVVDATVDEQKEMARKAYLEHCYVACMKEHDNLNPEVMARTINEVGPRKCIMATDFGQIHNPPPTEGMKLFVGVMLEQGISWRAIQTMCIKNPGKLFLNNKF